MAGRTLDMSDLGNGSRDILACLQVKEEQKWFWNNHAKAKKLRGAALTLTTLGAHPAFCGRLLAKAKRALCSQWGNDAFGSNRCVWKRGTAWEGAAIIDGLCYLGAWLGVTPGLVGFSGNSWNRHDEKERWVRVTEMKLKDNASANQWDSWGESAPASLFLFGKYQWITGLIVIIYRKVNVEKNVVRVSVISKKIYERQT